MTNPEDRVRDWLSRARSVLVLTGAGVSAESGIPTFRGSGGLWRNHDPMTLASPEGFARDPALVWEWYAWRRDLVVRSEPNPAHRALAALEERVDRFLLLTQNVDGLHQRAGSRNVQEIHGSILRVRCCETGEVYPPGAIPIRPPYPIRTAAGALARPDVVWFGERIREDAWEAVEGFLQESPPDVSLIMGTTGMFPYIQRWALVAKALGSRLVEVNPEPSDLSMACDVVLQGPAGEIAPRIVGLEPTPARGGETV